MAHCYTSLLYFTVDFLYFFKSFINFSIFDSFFHLRIILISLQYLFDNQTVRIWMDAEEKVKNKEAKLSIPSTKKDSDSTVYKLMMKLMLPGWKVWSFYCYNRESKFASCIMRDSFKWRNDISYRDIGLQWSKLAIYVVVI